MDWMHDAETWRREAERCLLQAERATSEAFRQRWLELARECLQRSRQASDL